VTPAVVSRRVSCSAAARARGDSLHATALSDPRFLLLEVPGPWGRSALVESRLDGDVAQQLATAAAAAAVRILLVRRPGRTPTRSSASGPLTWAMADATAGTGVLWGSWTEPAELLGLDLSGGIPASARLSGPQRVALICANAKRDQCCAVRGRPVAAAVAAVPGWDCWECSHLSGHRFAANMLLLPSGDLFGQLDPPLARQALERFDRGQILLSRHRGRCGQPAAEQAALYAVALRLGDCRRDALSVSAARPLPAEVPAGVPDGVTGSASSLAGLWELDVARGQHGRPDAVYRVRVAGFRPVPGLLSCADTAPKTELRYEAIGLVGLDAPAPAC
jgi:hypothetical protein